MTGESQRGMWAKQQQTSGDTEGKKKQDVTDIITEAWITEMIPSLKEILNCFLYTDGQIILKYNKKRTISHQTV